MNEPIEGAARDEAAVRLTVESVARGADLRQWDAVRAAFADEVELDYGTPERLSRDAIVDRWRPLFAGFDATHHAVTDVVPNVAGDSATATSRFRATHVARGAPGGDVWTLDGRYEHALTRTPRGWVVTRMRMIPERSDGNASLPQFALSRAPSDAPPSGPSPSHRAVVERFFTAYAAHDVGAVREVLAEDVVWRIPGHHPLAGEKRGVAEVLAFFDALGAAGFRAEPYAQAEVGNYVLDYHRGWSDAGPGLDLTWCLVFRFEGGRIREVTNFCADQHEADRFFWRVYRLRPIAERLAP